MQLVAKVTFCLAKNMCGMFISGTETEEAGLGVLEWTPTGFELKANKQERTIE